MGYCTWLCLALAPLARNGTAEANPRHQGLPAEGSPVSTKLCLTALFEISLRSSSVALSAKNTSSLGDLLKTGVRVPQDLCTVPGTWGTWYSGVPGVK